MDTPLEPQHPVHTKRKKITKRTKVALWLVLGPTVFATIAIILFTIINLVFNPTFWPTPDTEDFAATPIGITIANVFLLAVGSLSALAWLPGIVIGGILLAKKPKQD